MTNIVNSNKNDNNKNDGHGNDNGDDVLNDTKKHWCQNSKMMMIEMNDTNDDRSNNKPRGTRRRIHISLLFVYKCHHDIIHRMKQIKHTHTTNAMMRRDEACRQQQRTI